MTTLGSTSSSFAWAAPAGAGSNPAAAPSGPDKKPWTLAEIYGPGAHPGGPSAPTGFTWSPDGKHLTYQGPDGSLLEVDPNNGNKRALIPAEKLGVTSTRVVNEKDSDHRGRYNQPDYIWSPDSSRLLFDFDGTMWLYPLKGGQLKQVADSGQGSGDDPKFSPDGQTLSYVHEHNLYAVRPGQQPVALTTTHEPTLLNGEIDWVYLEELDVRSNYFWSPDSKQVAYLQMDEAQVPLYPLTDWIPAHPTIDQQRYPLAGDPNPSVKVGVVSAEGGATTWIKLPIRAGQDYIPRFGWLDPKTLWIETLTRDHKHLDLYFAEPATGQVKQVLEQADDKFLGDFSHAWYNITNYAPGEFLTLDWRDGHTHFYRYTYDAAHPLAAPAKLANPLEQGSYEANAVLSVDKTTRTVYYSSNENDPRDQQVWAVGLDGTGKHRVTQTPGTHTAEFAKDGSAYVDTFSNRETPTAVAICSGAERSACKTIFTGKAPAAHAQRLPELLELKAADGVTTLYGTLLLPEGATAPASVPLINNPYGGPGAMNVTNKWGGKGLYYDQLLAEHGFAVLHVDNRGGGNRGRAFVQASYHDFGQVQLADQLAAIDQVLAKYPQLDPKRLGWNGWSWGGTFTVNAMSHSTRFRAGAAGGTVSDFRNYDSIYTERYLGMPQENPEVYDKAAVNLSVHNLHGHLLLMQGTGDDNVHMGNTIQLVQKLIDANIPYNLQVYPRQTHSIATPSSNLMRAESIVNHFELYLKPVEDPAPATAGTLNPAGGKGAR